MNTTAPSTLRVAALSGSLRAGSYNGALLSTIQALAPATVRVDVLPIGDLPLLNPDLSPFPEPVRRLREEVRARDALLIATPEYNYSIPAPLKNALDWLSISVPQPADPCPLNGKPVAVLGASTGRIGTARAQLHLRQALIDLNVPVLNKPEIYVGFAGDKFAPDGTLTDEPTRKLLADHLAALVAWAHQLGVNGAPA